MKYLNIDSSPLTSLSFLVLRKFSLPQGIGEGSVYASVFMCKYETDWETLSGKIVDFPIYGC